MPASPQMLMSRIFASSMNFRIFEIIWEPLANDSRVDFYHYQVINSVNASVILESNTTNTSVIIYASWIMMVSFVLSACNCKGASIPVVLSIYHTINGED